MRNKEELIKVYNDCNITMDDLKNHFNMMSFIMMNHDQMVEVYLSLGNINENNLDPQITNMYGNLVDFCIKYFKPECARVLLEYGFKNSGEILEVVSDRTTNMLKYNDIISLCNEYNIKLKGNEDIHGSKEEV